LACGFDVKVQTMFGGPVSRHQPDLDAAVAGATRSRTSSRSMYLTGGAMATL
jgi:hypothetical protein